MEFEEVIPVMSVTAASPGDSRDLIGVYIYRRNRRKTSPPRSGLTETGSTREFSSLAYNRRMHGSFFGVKRSSVALIE